MIHGATRWSRWAGRGRSTRRGSPASSGCARWWCRPASGAASALGFLAAPVAYEAARSWPDADRGAGLRHRGVDPARARGGRTGAPRRGRGGRGRGRWRWRWRRALRLRPGRRHRAAGGHAPPGPDAPDLGPPAGRAPVAGEPARGARCVRRRVPAPLHPPLRRCRDRGAELAGGVHRGAGRGPLRPARGGRGTGRRRRERRRRGRQREGGPQGPPTGVGSGTRRLRGRPGPRPVRDGAGPVVEGPAIIEEREATTIVPDACTLTVDAGRNLVLTLAETVPSRIVVGTDTALEEAVARIEAESGGGSRSCGADDQHRRGVLADRHPHRVLAHHRRGSGLRVRDPRRRRAADRAFPARHAGLQPHPADRRQCDARTLPAETLQPGDVLVTNDPWLCAGHLFDIAIAAPVFRDGKVVAFCGVVGHVTDIAAPRTASTPARSTRKGSRSRP